MRVKQGDFLAVHVEEIAEAGAVEAIPALREQFARGTDPTHKDDLDPWQQSENRRRLSQARRQKPDLLGLSRETGNARTRKRRPLPR
jgi:hypothetical protein